MHVIDRVNEINLFGNVHKGDLEEFFREHQWVVDTQEECACGTWEDYDSWPVHVMDEFIEWLGSL